jgi:hypothetical protein
MMAHLTERQLERWLAEEPVARSEEEVAGHLAACSACRARLDALAQERARYLQRHPVDTFTRAVVERSAQARPNPQRSRWLSPLVASAGIAATVALLWGLRAPSPSAFSPSSSEPAASVPAIRFKGSVGFEVHVKRAARSVRVQDGDVLTAGDQLAFIHVLPRARHLLLLGIDDAGAVTRYFPTDAAPSVSLVEAGRQQLAVGVELDARKGEERLFALFSDRPLVEAEIRGTMQDALRRARQQGLGISELSRLGVSDDEASVWFRKL